MHCTGFIFLLEKQRNGKSFFLFHIYLENFQPGLERIWLEMDELKDSGYSCLDSSLSKSETLLDFELTFSFSLFPTPFHGLNDYNFNWRSRIYVFIIYQYSNIWVLNKYFAQLNVVLSDERTKTKHMTTWFLTNLSTLTIKT